MRFEHVAQLKLPTNSRKYNHWDVDVTVDLEENTVDLEVERGYDEGARLFLSSDDATALRDALTRAIGKLR